MEVGELISLFRKQSGMTIDELAAKSGVPKGTLNKIIGGVTKAPTLDNMKSIAKALGKTLADFDDSLTDTKNPPSTAEAAPGEESVSSEEVREVLQALGLIREDLELSDSDLVFMDHIIGLMDAWFSEHP